MWTPFRRLRRDGAGPGCSSAGRKAPFGSADKSCRRADEMSWIKTLPTIPRFYTAVAQWLGVLIFVRPFTAAAAARPPAGGNAAAGLAALILELVLTELPVVWMPSMLYHGADAGAPSLLADLRRSARGTAASGPFWSPELGFCLLSWQLYSYGASRLNGAPMRWGGCCPPCWLSPPCSRRSGGWKVAITRTGAAM